MGTVSLPPSEPGTPSYYTNGLATPPESPANASRRTHSTPVLHTILAYNPTPCIYFNVTRPTRELVVGPNYTNFKTATLEESAFQTPVPYVTLFVPDLGAEILVGGAPSGAMAHGHSSHPVTVSNVLNTLGLWLSQVVTREECKALPPPVMATATQYLQARTKGYPGSDGMRRFDLLCGRIFFVGLTRTNDGSNRWIVHLSSRV
ncbi:hypothetical protein BDM02DRAFT_3108905 [Thelephora ganbajun]|uniref:Uncharacterized protein n=1 Tax=Thelephora ganbajun TaxID=370292 RepID=A0ACB6ZTJ6_THEGA|nr:hypothetical protein BDM02DRAFT_3108905 [Thelephora ganbajun]